MDRVFESGQEAAGGVRNYMESDSQTLSLLSQGGVSLPLSECLSSCFLPFIPHYLTLVVCSASVELRRHIPLYVLWELDQKEGCVKRKSALTLMRC